MRTLILVLALSALGAAQHPVPQPPRSHGIMGNADAFADAHVNALDRQVGLSGEQRVQVRAIFTEEAGRLGAIMSDGSLTLEQRQAKLQKLHVESRERVVQVLTPEQRSRMPQPPAMPDPTPAPKRDPRSTRT
ncbi:MAG TPA: hypothetical protein VEG32_01125 [Clostridia bacterium]|nr:hypothetical protein [Clostridia bacterium]